MTACRFELELQLEARYRETLSSAWVIKFEHFCWYWVTLNQGLIDKSDALLKLCGWSPDSTVNPIEKK